MSNDFNRSLLHEERIKKGLNITELANKLGCSQSMVSKWESGMAKPRSSSIRKLCDFCEVEPEYWEHFYHEPQKPLDSFTPKPPVREEAREAFDKAVNPHEADKDKVRENLEKINKPNSFAEAIKNVGKALVGDDIEHDAYKQAALQVISDLKNEIKAKDTEIQGLKCELEGLKVENARLQGNVDGLTTQLFLKNDDMKDIAEDSVKESLWERIFG